MARQEAVAIQQRVVFCVGLDLAQPVSLGVWATHARLNEPDSDPASLSRHPNSMYGTNSCVPGQGDTPSRRAGTVGMTGLLR